SLESDEGLASAQVAAVGVAVDRRFDLEDGDLAAAEVFVAAHAQPRRVAAHAVDDWIGAVGLLAAYELEVEIQIAVEPDVRDLALSGDRQRAGARQSKGSERFLHPLFGAGRAHCRTLRRARRHYRR